MINNLTDEEIKKLCKEKTECYWPEIHIIRSTIADTPVFIREYFMELGKRQNES